MQEAQETPAMVCSQHIQPEQHNLCKSGQGSKSNPQCRIASTTLHVSIDPSKSVMGSSEEHTTDLRHDSSAEEKQESKLLLQ